MVKSKKSLLIDDLDLLIEKMGLNSTQSKKLSVLNAPMPGLVTGIKITEGQEVEKGTPLIILEAMKMENVIIAPHHAIIKQINVSLARQWRKERCWWSLLCNSCQLVRSLLSLKIKS